MNSQSKMLLGVLVVIILCVIGYRVLTMPDHRGFGDRVSDAAHDLEDRTPGQKLGDAVKDTGDKIKANTSSHD